MPTLTDLFRRLEHLNEIGAALSAERDIDVLLEKILLAAKEITRADGGTLYRPTADGYSLQFAIVRTDSLGLAFGGPNGAPLASAFSDLPLYLPDGTANHAMVAARAALGGVTINIADAYAERDFDFSGTRQFDARTGYRSQSFLTVPMQNHEGELIGVLQLINAIDPASGEVTAFSPADQRLAESLASQAAIALSNRQLVGQLEGLFESFIGVINLAIDEKSPHTGGHCQRVPALTMLLADAVDAVDSGPLADFRLTAKDRYELHIAALLHDCGKVTTPVHVVDKATKLQTLFDRIALVDTRFELLRRDAEVRKWRSIAEGRPADEAERDYAEFCGQLDVDRDFLRHANRGSERMSDEDIARVHRIADRYRWQSPDGSDQPCLDADEVLNLTIRAGTLTTAEREIINHHIVATIRMLEQLPWPKHLQNVPEYAGGHHERMDGKGYPKGLKREEMSWQARMMGIADIFEALTAKDRPYKPAMKLSQALKIMENFRNNGHIDPDLFDVFVDRQVYRRYSEAWLDAGQVDC
ncbi:HD-GYP domain-containing protein (c-di-GMP phosphodiesterase class II) [Azonexus fungiphilus]|uniref:HD-GYP domain-containing protein (C-di-GMP phosphodiesterase class II) n=1 Tax=Azonexus fungiphilus TaxID=146940 RepID=A0A495VLS7_9RHOO|nr:HD family phosphohydrolase [Azonexus fungiphilus]RKT50351.1 HD-GYP domain-containing protein (c-di-GMP phosphodiesterase class II) [Azonexus fungiphilus]